MSSVAQGGWIKLRWSTKDSLQGSCAASLGLWTFLLLSASHKQRVLPSGRVLAPGELLVSVKSLSARLELSRKTVDRFLQAFERDGAIEVIKRDRNGTHLRLCNFTTYQGLNETTGEAKGKHRERIGKATEKQRKSNETHTESPKSPKSPKESKRLDASASCSELAPPPSEPDPASGRADDPVVMEFPCSGEGPQVWPLRAAKVAEYREAYPGIDLDVELRKARQWCRDNAKRRKTYRGMGAFLANWLSKAQDEATRKARGSPAASPQQRRHVSSEELGEILRGP